MVAAFGIAPDTQTEIVPRRLVEETLSAQAERPPPLETQIFSYHDRIQRGDTVASLLSRLSANDPQALAFLKSDPVAKGVFGELTPGKTLHARATAEGELVELRLRADADEAIRVLKAGDAYQSYMEPIQLMPHRALKSGTIKSSLFAATDAAGVPDAVATQLTKLFATQIDFHKDLQRGDRFCVVYEVLSDGADVVKVGRVLAAEFVNQGRSHKLVYFEPPGGGKGEYYDPAKATKLRAQFLRSPIEFSRVSSGFSMGRFNPVRGVWQAHKGVDFPAPSGTPVVATSDGTVDFIGRQTGYGNVIELKHHDQYGTLYAHLSRFARGLRLGDTVTQGEVIGYVGATGWATGPHLHYEFKIAGVHHDPQGSAVPVGVAMASDFRREFEQAAAPLLAQLEMMRNPAVAAVFE